MKCAECGNELPDGAKFCNICGQPIEKKSICEKCGAELYDGAEFCGNCGYSAKSVRHSEAGTEKTAKKVRWGIIVPVAAVCVIILSIMAGYITYSIQSDNWVNEKITDTASTKKRSNSTKKSAYNKKVSSKKQSKSKPKNTLSPNAKNEQNSDAETSSAATVSDRRDLYNPSLTYNRMPEIHSSVLVDDSMFNTVKSVIEEFNKQCADYMNEITDKVPSYLKAGTTAYNQQVEYKQVHPNLNQSYQKVDVINARQGGGYYYVWVTEVLNVNENGEAKVVTDHWVYKLENENGRWYICDYTVDPAF